MLSEKSCFYLFLGEFLYLYKTESRHMFCSGDDHAGLWDDDMMKMMMVVVMVVVIHTRMQNDETKTISITNIVIVLMPCFF